MFSVALEPLVRRGVQPLVREVPQTLLLHDLRHPSLCVFDDIRTVAVRHERLQVLQFAHPRNLPVLAHHRGRALTREVRPEFLHRVGVPFGEADDGKVPVVDLGDCVLNLSLVGDVRALARAVEVVHVRQRRRDAPRTRAAAELAVQHAHLAPLDAVKVLLHRLGRRVHRRGARANGVALVRGVAARAVLVLHRRAGLEGVDEAGGDLLRGHAKHADHLALVRGHLRIVHRLGSERRREVLLVARAKGGLARGDLRLPVVVEHPVVVHLRQLGVQVVVVLAPVHERLVLKGWGHAVSEVDDIRPRVSVTHPPHEVAARLRGQRRDAHARAQNHGADDLTRQAVPL
mmetsp:Transcript_3383/g.13449  ORF Transcript_3383/g.13449 Transcript_3383/m.13449 type:complete len:345 (+) Transcript_3383:96-1130(+)